MQELQLKDFGRFRFMNRWDKPLTIKGAEVREINDHAIKVIDLEGTIYPIKKAKIISFTPMHRRIYFFNSKK